MKSFQLASLKDPSFFSQPVYIDSKFIIGDQDIPLTKEKIQLIAKWQFGEVFSDGDLAENQKSANVGVENEHVYISAKDDVFKDVIAQAQKSATEFSLDEDATNMLIAKTVYESCYETILGFYNTYTTQKTLDLKVIIPFAKSLCMFEAKYKRFLLRLPVHENLDDEGIIITHSLRSTILAVAIALSMRFSISRLSELAIACIFHEIGMTRFPKQVYTQTGRLSAAEKRTILMHPILSYNVLKSTEFSNSICIAVLEHHERENGTGYPRKLTGDQISAYAKIISVACVYEAITATRPYKQQQDLSEAVIELLRNAKKQFDPVVIKVALSCLSIYPIGTYVELTNGLKGIVVDVSPENVKAPVVKILGKTNEDGSAATVNTASSKLKIQRTLGKREIEALQ